MCIGSNFQENNTQWIVRYVRVSTGGTFFFPFLKVQKQMVITISKTPIRAPTHMIMTVIRVECLLLLVS
jgi:hypothetical protein